LIILFCFFVWQVRAALLATFDPRGIGAVSFRAFVAGLAPLARTAEHQQVGSPLSV
jgi:hypothetical protein